MSRQYLRKLSAFTLIELLVVVAIIALLLSILLPALSRAKEQGRIAVCTANERSIGQAAVQYQLDGSDDLPWALPFRYGVNNQTYIFSYISEVVWGGAMPDKVLPQDWTATGYPASNGPDPGGDNYRLPPRYRPMNKYLSSTVSWDDGRRDTATNRVNIRPEVPGFFKCPSDADPLVPLVGNANDQPRISDTPFQMWDFWGTSYPINWYWPYYYYQAPPGNAPPYNSSFTRIIGADINPPPAGAGVKGLGRYMLKDKGGRWASEFIVFYEGRMNFAMERAAPPGHSGAPWSTGRKSYKGWHGEKDRYVAIFLDGHAEYKKMDTRFNFGTGWTTWPNKPWEGNWAQYNDNPPTDQYAN